MNNPPAAAHAQGQQHPLLRRAAEQTGVLSPLAIRWIKFMAAIFLLTVVTLFIQETVGQALAPPKRRPARCPLCASATPSHPRLAAPVAATTQGMEPRAAAKSEEWNGDPRPPLPIHALPPIVLVLGGVAGEPEGQRRRRRRRERTWASEPGAMAGGAGRRPYLGKRAAREEASESEEEEEEGEGESESERMSEGEESCGSYELGIVRGYRLARAARAERG